VNVFARVEFACAHFVEAAFARVFPSALEPAQVGRKLVATMQSTPSDTFVVRVNPLDYERFATDRTFLEKRWSALLADAMTAPSTEKPRAILAEDPQVVAGSVTIEALVDESPTLLAIEGTTLRDGLTIGRALDCGIVVPNVRVSRFHAKIVAERGGFAIEDTGSTNGTFVNGERIGRRTLASGDEIGVGDALLRLEVTRA